MRRISIVLCGLLLSGMLFAEMEFAVGGGVNYQHMNLSSTTDPQKIALDFNTIGFQGFFDATYVSIGLEYMMSIGDPSATMYIDDEKNDLASEVLTDAMEGYTVTYFDIVLLGKYPFKLNPVTLFPALGLEYKLNLTMKQDDTDLKENLSDNDKSSLNDLILLVGGGMDFNFTKHLFMRFNALFGFNLTASQQEDLMGEFDSYSGWNLRLELALAYKF